MKASFGESEGGEEHTAKKHYFSNLCSSIFTCDGLLNWICSRVGTLIRIVCWPLFVYFKEDTVTFPNMTIATLTLHWDSLNAAKTGWRVKINGLIYSQREDFKRRFPDKVKEEDPNGQTLVISAEDEPAFDRNSPYDLPMYVVIQYLKVLAEMKYRVVATHSTITQDYNHSTTVWTLQMK